jgi:ribosomal protein S18 acetylase RimI-like enzyme
MDARHGLAAGYRIRVARDEDVERACQIARRAWVPIHDSFRAIMGDAMHDAVCGDWQDNKAQQIVGHWERSPGQMTVVEREADGAVVAFLTYRLDEARSLGEIGNNAVADAEQGKGIGSAMYRHALALFRQRGMRFACVATGLDDGHGPARRAYQKVGFHIAREDVTYYMVLDEAAR